MPLPTVKSFDMSVSLLHPRRQRWIAFLSGLLMALAVMAPTVSRALAAEGVGGWEMVCSADGMRWVQAGDEEGDEAHAAGGDHGFSLDVCPLCVLATDRQAPPSLPPALPVLAAAAQIVADLVVPPPPVLRVPWSAPPRGPPADAPLWF